MTELMGGTRFYRRWLLAMLCVVTGWTIQASAQQQPTTADNWTKEHRSADADRLFTLKVLPLLTEKCFGCHGSDPDDIKGEYLMLDRASLLRGGESDEVAVHPGKAAKGTLLEAIRWDGLEMPPKENDRLSDQQIQWVELWIAAGAPWPDKATQEAIRKQDQQSQETADGILIKTSGGTSDQWSSRRYQADKVWAFQPVRPASELLPKGVDAAQAIDHFIDRRLQEANLTPAPPAKPAALLRRACLDLTGLPPTDEQRKQFITAWEQDSQQAWENLIDQLLASPRYGERWGRHWLDVTRYADTGGMSNDYERSNLWRYRDYVIRSFNEDRPYNEFIVQQLAGDELADESVAKRLQKELGNKATAQKIQQRVRQAQQTGQYTAQEAEWIVASGFLRLGPWDNAMVKADEARQMYLDDLVNITGQTFLSTTMRCCKCHDHKFDPIPTRDYYRMYSAFSTTQMAERTVPFTDKESLTGIESGRAHVQRMLDYATSKKNALINKQETAAKHWYKEHDLPYVGLNQRKSMPDESKPPRHVGLDYVDQGRLKVREQDVWIWNRRLERYQPMAQSVFSDAWVKIPGNAARKLRIVRNGDGKVRQNHILMGGALTALGDVVTPGVLSAIGLPVQSALTAPANDNFQISDNAQGRRLELARWIANPENALTTRSIVNRIWQYHFGRGLAANSNNFGVSGSAPTHPELLDFLADDFIAGDWKIKRLHRRMMLSEAYQRSAEASDPDQVANVDPDNLLLSHFQRRRLSAEEIRDSALMASGELVHQLGGLPVSPEINMEVALQPRMIQFSLAPAYQPSRTPAERNRRSIYAYQVRGQADPFMELFNLPNPNESSEQRESAAVTPQVFSLMNSDMMTDRSIALALRAGQHSDQVGQQITQAFQWVLGRTPSSTEHATLEQYVQRMTRYHQSMPEDSVNRREYPKQITRSLVEEFSGKPFQYTEILPVFNDYVADQSASDVGPQVRALADACLLLLNTNEFMYVD